MSSLSLYEYLPFSHFGIFLGHLLTDIPYLEGNHMPDTGPHSSDKVTCCCLVRDLGFSILSMVIYMNPIEPDNYHVFQP